MKELLCVTFCVQETKGTGRSGQGWKEDNGGVYQAIGGRRGQGEGWRGDKEREGSGEEGGRKGEVERGRDERGMEREGQAERGTGRQKIEHQSYK